MPRLTISTLTVSVALTGCITLTSDPVSVNKLTSIESSSRELTLLNTVFLGEMTLALAKQGFRVMPFSSQETITEQRTESITSQRRQASTRYGLVLQIEGTRQVCAFTDYRIVNATASIIDLRTNEAVAILKQRGSDGPCTTVIPVFDPLATEIGKLWK